MRPQQNKETDDRGQLTLGRVVALFGGLCVAHAVVWWFLRVPATGVDPFVGAEGLAVGGLLLVVVGLGPLSEQH